MIEVRDISKNYGDITGVKNLNFSTEPGEILGFLGSNGAGKTTTMNIVTGYMPPSSGQVLINGIDLYQQPMEAKRMIGFLPENPPVYPALQVDHYLKFVSEIKGVPSRERTTHVNRIMESVGLTDVSKRLIQNLSKGYRQRVGLAQALVSDPEFIVLDEPTVGLDPKQITEIRSLIQEIGKKSTVMISSHILTEINMICDRVIIIRKGEIVAVNTPANLADKLMEFDRFMVRVKAPVVEFEERCREIHGINSVSLSDSDRRLPEGFNEFILESSKSLDVRSPLFLMMSEMGYIAHEIKSLDVGLEDVFLKFTDTEN